MRRALNEYRIVGIKTNIPFHQQIINDTRFIGGQFDTKFVEHRFAMVEEERERHLEAAAIAALLFALSSKRRAIAPIQPKRTISNWKRAGRLEAMR
jgi:acetyl/propionyl-CoA carboxylase alpha subunit